LAFMADTRRLATSTAVFGVATAISRVAGLVREISAAAVLGSGPVYSAFTVAFNLPNLIRAIVADNAISAAFVPVFLELREKGEEKEAWRGAPLGVWEAPGGVGGRQPGAVDDRGGAGRDLGPVHPAGAAAGAGAAGRNQQRLLRPGGDAH